jgi:hypothetical protein
MEIVMPDDLFLLASMILMLGTIWLLTAPVTY